MYFSAQTHLREKEKIRAMYQEENNDPTSSDYLELDRRHIWHPCSQMKDYETLQPILVERAQGSYLYDVDGKAYLDIISSWWCNLLGHAHPRLSAVLADQAATLEHVIFANFTHKPAVDLCVGLREYLPSGLTKFFFSDNGSAAVEVALKMSFQYHQQTGHSQKTRFMAFDNAYHGETLGALSVGGVGLYSRMYEPLLLDVIRVPAPDCYRCPHGKERSSCGAECMDVVESLIEKHGAETSAFIVEPLFQGAGGMRIYPPLVLKRIRSVTEKHGVHLIADEIATGFGRTGTMFACDQAGIEPEFMCLSKGLTAGYMPMSITVTTDKIYDAFYADYAEGRAFMHSHTYSGNPLGCRLALEVLRILKEESVLERAREKSAFLTCLLRDAFEGHPHVGDIRSIGLIHGIELVKDKETKEAFPFAERRGYAVYKEALKRGLLLRPCGDVLYFNPPLTIEYDEMRQAVALAAEALQAVGL